MTKAKEYTIGGTRRVNAVFIDTEMQELYEMRMRPFRQSAQDLENRIYNKSEHELH